MEPDFMWSLKDEPHATRRRQIVAKYPHIKRLFAVDPSFVWVASAVVLTQTAIAAALAESDWVLLCLQAYLAGGTFNHGIVLAEHDISHNAAFGNARPLANRLFGMWAQLPLTLPMSVSFKKYHVEHHRYLGCLGRDTDLPTRFEIKLFRGPIGKLLWLLFQPVFYAFRPLITYPKVTTDLEVLNLAVQLAYNLLILMAFGRKSLAYLFLSTWFGLGLHPSSGHFISDHYVFAGGHDTASYYGCINRVTYNVGYHNEHHDFPAVPARNLPQVRAIAPEFYAGLPCHSSWLASMWRFVLDDDLGLHRRIARPPSQPPQFYHWHTRLHNAVAAAIAELRLCLSLH